MIFIAHRGNISGIDKENENSPHYLIKAINLGFDVEVDFRILKNKIFFGHDKGDYEIDNDWLRKYKSSCWFHAKNIEGLSYLLNYQYNIDSRINFFWHQDDDYTLTSQGYIWAYPGKEGGDNCIAVLPEINNTNISKFGGICSDVINKYIK